jgi:hypothetical protein
MVKPYDSSHGVLSFSAKQDWLLPHVSELSYVLVGLGDIPENISLLIIWPKRIYGNLFFNLPISKQAF